MSKVAMADLPLCAVVQMASRLGAFGVASVGHEGSDLPRGVAEHSFHGQSALVGGVLHFLQGCDVDEYAHEGCHLLIAPPDLRKTITGDGASWSGYIAGEEAIMWLQVELQRDVPMRGVRRAVADMEAIGYGFGNYPCEQKGTTWWRGDRSQTADQLARYGLPTMAEIRQRWSAIRPRGVREGRE